jgi:hypothetical protein
VFSGHALTFAARLIPPHEIVDLVVEVLIFEVSMSEAMRTQCSLPASDTVNRAFLRLRAMGLMKRSTVFESISMRPSSTKRVRPSQRESA